MSVIRNNLLLTDDGYNISRSVRLRSSASAYFSRTYGTPTDAKKWTLSFWLKRGLIGSASYQIMSAGSAISDQFHISADSLSLYLGGSYRLVTTQVLRDPSAWYHIVLVIDTANATADNRNIMYINGVQVTSFSTRSNLSLNATTNLNAASTVTYIGRYAASSAEYTDGYLTEINFIDGQALTPSSFGETDSITGVWKPKKYAGTYGTNGFFLNFSDNSNNTAATIGKDSSGNGNNWTPNNISVTSGVTYDSMLDVPTMWADGGNGRGNYAVMNPINTLATLSAANLKVTNSAASNQGSKGTFLFPSTGLWYCECVVAETTTASKQIGFGLGTPDVALNISTSASNSWGFVASSGSLIVRNGTQSGSLAFGVFPAGTVLQLAVDLANSRAWLGINNTWYNSTTGTDGNPSSGTNPTLSSLPAEIYPFVFALYQCSCDLNFGQRPFSYTPPTGFKALNTQNLPDATIKKGNAYFDASLYTGNSSTQSVTNSSGFQPDLLWIKARSAGGYDNVLQDSVRGSTNQLFSNTTGAEESDPDAVTSFNSNGFSLGGDVTVNNSGVTFVGWQWKESVSAGFDIVTYTGTGANRTVAHSLGVAPSLIILKQRSTADYWTVWHSSIANTEYLLLNSTNGKSTAATYWNSTSPTSSVFSLGTDSRPNGSGVTYVAYLFAEVAGYSKFGSYTGNGSTDGPFVYLGFRPKYIMWKRTDSTGDWSIMDTGRWTYNACYADLNPNNSDAEGADAYNFDILSNGFKVRQTYTAQNANGGTYIYAAFAENPFKNSLAR